MLFALAVGISLLASTGPADAGKHRIAVADQFLKATYFPIKLRAPGDPQEIRYDISCLPPDGNADGPGVCDGGGTVYFRSSANVSASVPLQLDANAQAGRYVAAVPSSIWSAPWFTYYAVIRDNTTGRTIVVPQGGSAAPQISFAIGGSTIALGDHPFGSTRQATARVASPAPPRTSRSTRRACGRRFFRTTVERRSTRPSSSVVRRRALLSRAETWSSSAPATRSASRRTRRSAPRTSSRPSGSRARRRSPTSSSRRRCRAGGF